MNVSELGVLARRHNILCRWYGKDSVEATEARRELASAKLAARQAEAVALARDLAQFDGVELLDRLIESQVPAR